MSFSLGKVGVFSLAWELRVGIVRDLNPGNGRAAARAGCCNFGRQAMRMRRMMLGLIGSIAMCAAADGQPPKLPVGPLSEGREVDPVTREFYLPEKPTGAQNETPISSLSTNTAAE